jgi:hypothetical protein
MPKSLHPLNISIFSQRHPHRWCVNYSRQVSCQFLLVLLLMVVLETVNLPWSFLDASRSCRTVQHLDMQHLDVHSSLVPFVLTWTAKAWLECHLGYDLEVSPTGSQMVHSLGCVLGVLPGQHSQGESSLPTG